jgi:hypothetical protein
LFLNHVGSFELFHINSQDGPEFHVLFFGKAAKEIRIIDYLRRRLNGRKVSGFVSLKDPFSL